MMFSIKIMKVDLNEIYGYTKFISDKIVSKIILTRFFFFEVVKG